MSKKMAGKMGGGIGGMGKSNAKVYIQDGTGITFKDVAGQDEAKESLMEIVDYLHSPGKYADVGAKLPKGALLVGLLPVQAKHCWQRLWQVKRACRIFQFPVRILWRCLWVWVHPGL